MKIKCPVPNPKVVNCIDIKELSEMERILNEMGYSYKVFSTKPCHNYSIKDWCCNGIVEGCHFEKVYTHIVVYHCPKRKDNANIKDILRNPENRNIKYTIINSLKELKKFIKDDKNE